MRQKLYNSVFIKLAVHLEVNIQLFAVFYNDTVSVSGQKFYNSFLRIAQIIIHVRAICLEVYSHFAFPGFIFRYQHEY
jgi:hypothetical protein